MGKAPKHKKGRKFEELIVWIQKCVHDRANIEANLRVRDMDTGKYRQIDIGLRLTDGPTEFFGIVEVRDWTRPIGVRYVEEVSAKRRSVRADAVFLVSRSGFTKTALIKAEQLGIRALTYEEATSANWSDWLQCRTLSVIERKFDNVILAFSEFGDNKVMGISPETLSTFQSDKASKILRTEEGTPYASLPDFIRIIINSLADKLYNGIPMDGTHCRRVILIHENKYEPALFIERRDGKLCRIGALKIEVDCYNEIKEYPIKLMRYRQADIPESIAEVATAEIDSGQNKLQFELVAPGACESIPEGTTVSLRMTQLLKNTNEKQ